MNSRMEIGHALKRLMNDQQMIKSNLLLVQAGQDEGIWQGKVHPLSSVSSFTDQRPVPSVLHWQGEGVHQHPGSI